MTGITFSRAFLPTETATIPAVDTASITADSIQGRNCLNIPDNYLFLFFTFYNNPVTASCIKQGYNDRININKNNFISASSEQLTNK